MAGLRLGVSLSRSGAALGGPPPGYVYITFNGSPLAHEGEPVIGGAA